MPLIIRSGEPADEVMTVHLQGRLDSETAPDFEAELHAFTPANIQVLVIDLAGLEYLSSAGIRSLFTARMEMQARNGKLILVSPQPAVQRVLDMVRIVEAESILASADEMEL